jgi:hypothetical protein
MSDIREDETKRWSLPRFLIMLSPNDHGTMARAIYITLQLEI